VVIFADAAADVSALGFCLTLHLVTHTKYASRVSTHNVALVCINTNRSTSNAASDAFTQLHDSRLDLRHRREDKGRCRECYIALQCVRISWSVDVTLKRIRHSFVYSGRDRPGMSSIMNITLRYTYIKGRSQVFPMKAGFSICTWFDMIYTRKGTSTRTRRRTILPHGGKGGQMSCRSFPIYGNNEIHGDVNLN
jgi:hypothetical protein